MNLDIKSFIYEVPLNFIQFIKKHAIFNEKETYDNCVLYEYIDKEFPNTSYRHIKIGDKYYSENILIYQHAKSDVLKDIIDQNVKDKIIEKCGNSILTGGFQCQICNCFEIYKDRYNPNDIDRRIRMIISFFDGFLECLNCGEKF